MRNYRLLTFLVLSILILSACQSSAAPTAAPEATAMPVQVDETEQNMAVVRRFYEEFSKGNADVILEVHSPTILMHYAGSAEEVPAQSLRDDLAAIKAANPELHAEIKDMFAQGNIVVTELTWTGTHAGDLFGIPATGKTFTHNGIVVRRLEEGKIVESWEMWDDLEFMHSLGLLPSWEEVVSQPTSQPESASQANANEPVGAYRVKLGGSAVLGVDPGYYGLTLKEDGTYTMDWAPMESQGGMVGVTGTYIVEDGQIVLTDVEGFAACSTEEGVSGTYTWLFSSEGLILTPVQDTCEARVLVLSTKPLPRREP
jgi:steroid delta-isomerase-like uncharacterized protein